MRVMLIFFYASFLHTRMKHKKAVFVLFKRFHESKILLQNTVKMVYM